MENCGVWYSKYAHPLHIDGCWTRKQFSLLRCQILYLSITRIAGLTWSEWNERLSMPLVTQLREGVRPLVFPTDLRMGKLPVAAGAAGLSLKGISKVERKSPMKRANINASPTPEAELSGAEDTACEPGAAGASSTPLNCSSASEKDKSSITVSVAGGGDVKLQHLSEEEATVLMLKAAAEKSAAAAAAAANNSGNLSDNSYSDDPGNLSGNGALVGGPGDFHSAFADVGAAGLNINILNSLNAMNSLIAGPGGNAGGYSASGLAAGAAGAGANSGFGGGANGAGHPCPECGRVYKLKSSLRNHQKWECGKEPQFQCPFCVYRAKQKMHIGRHMERMHKEKFFKIEDLKSFTTSTINTQQLAGSSLGAGVGRGGGGGGGGGGDDSTAGSGGEESSSAPTVAELRQQFSS